MQQAHFCCVRYKRGTVFDISIAGKVALMEKQEESSLIKKFQEPNDGSDSSLEVVGACSPQKTHFAKGLGCNLQQKKRRGGRVPFLRSHAQLAMFTGMKAELKHNKSKGRSQEEMQSSDQGGNVLEPRQPTELRSAAQADARNVPKLPGEVELHTQQQKDGDEDPSLQFLNPADVSEQASCSVIYDRNRDAKAIRQSTHLKSVQLDDRLGTRRSRLLKSAQSDMLCVPRFPQEVEPKNQKQKDGNEDTSIQFMKLIAEPRESSPLNSCKDILTNGIKNDDQQPVKRKDNLEALQQSVGLRSFPYSECEILNSVAYEKTAMGEQEPFKKAGNATTLQNNESPETNGKEDGESNCIENFQDSDYESERSVEILDVFSPNKAHRSESESDNPQPPKRSGRRRPFLRSDGPVTYSFVVETKVNSEKRKDRSEELLIIPETSSSKRRHNVKEKSQSSQLKSAHLGEPHASGDPSLQSVNLRATSKDEHVPLSQNMDRSQEQEELPNTAKHVLYGKFLSNRRPVTTEERLRAKEVARKFNSNNPFFMIVMPSTYVYGRFFMHIPKDFVKKYIRREVQYINLAVLDGRRWPVRCLHKGSQGVGLGKGWAAFVWENNLEEGDVCIFELVNRKKIEFMVFIFRVVEEIVPLVRVMRRRKSQKAGSSQ